MRASSIFAFLSILFQNYAPGWNPDCKCNIQVCGYKEWVFGNYAQGTQVFIVTRQCEERVDLGWQSNRWSIQMIKGSSCTYICLQKNFLSLAIAVIKKNFSKNHWLKKKGAVCSSKYLLGIFCPQLFGHFTSNSGHSYSWWFFYLCNCPVFLQYPQVFSRFRQLSIWDSNSIFFTISRQYFVGHRTGK